MQRLQSGLKPVPIHSMHCNGQRGDNSIGNDPRRPNLITINRKTKNESNHTKSKRSIRND